MKRPCVGALVDSQQLAPMCMMNPVVLAVERPPPLHSLAEALKDCSEAIL